VVLTSADIGKPLQVNSGSVYLHPDRPIIRLHRIIFSPTGCWSGLGLDRPARAGLPTCLVCVGHWFVLSTTDVVDMASTKDDAGVRILGEKIVGNGY